MNSYTQQIRMTAVQAIMIAFTCVLQKARRDVLAEFHVITPCHTEYSGRSHSFA
jgi:hypothetical protein